MEPIVITSLIGVSGVMLTAGLAFATAWKERILRVEAQHELRMQSDSLDFSRFMTEWDDTYRDLSNILNETNIDRFMIFRAWNGHLEPRWTTSIFQVRKGLATPISYVHIELDVDYVERLREVSARRPVKFLVSSLPPSVLKGMYDAEGISAAMWAHIETSPVGKKLSSAVTYCTFATKEGDIDQSTYARCMLFVSRLKGVAESFRREETR